jgi:WD40 repeat protein
MRIAWLWDIGTGELVGALHGYTAAIHELAHSPDGRMLASCGSFDQTLRLWDLPSGALVCTLQHPNWVAACAFTADTARPL